MRGTWLIESRSAYLVNIVILEIICLGVYLISTTVNYFISRRESAKAAVKWSIDSSLIRVSKYLTASVIEILRMSYPPGGICERSNWFITIKNWCGNGTGGFKTRPVTVLFENVTTFCLRVGFDGGWDGWTGYPCFMGIQIMYISTYVHTNNCHQH